MAGGLLATLGSAPVAFDTAIGFDNNTTVDTTAPLTTGGTLAMPDPRALTKRGTNVWSIGGTLFGSHASYRSICVMVLCALRQAADSRWTRQA